MADPKLHDLLNWHRHLDIPTKPPPLLYHYTSAEGLAGILNSGHIQAGHVAFMNDPSETHFLLGKPSQDPFYHHYVASFSSHEDDLSLWRAYGDNGRGFAVGISPPDVVGWGIGKVVYGAIKAEVEKRSVEYATEFTVFDDPKMSQEEITSALAYSFRLRLPPFTSTEAMGAKMSGDLSEAFAPQGSFFRKTELPNPYRRRIAFTHEVAEWSRAFRLSSRT